MNVLVELNQKYKTEKKEKNKIICNG